MLAGCRVLVVEDEAMVAESISVLLAEAEGGRSDRSHPSERRAR